MAQLHITQCFNNNLKCSSSIISPLVIIVYRLSVRIFLSRIAPGSEHVRCVMTDKVSVLLRSFGSYLWNGLSDLRDWFFHFKAFPLGLTLLRESWE